MASVRSEPCFTHGRVVLSRRVVQLALQGRLDVVHFFRRHLHGDWGNLPLVYGVMNEHALRDGKRNAISCFRLDPTLTLTVVTKLDRGVTTLLFPEEYHTVFAESTH